MQRNPQFQKHSNDGPMDSSSFHIVFFLNFLGGLFVGELFCIWMCVFVFLFLCICIWVAYLFLKLLFKAEDRVFMYLGGMFVGETVVWIRKESNDLELEQRRLLRAWEPVAAGRPRATAHPQSFVQKNLIRQLNQTNSPLKFPSPCARLCG